MYDKFPDFGNNKSHRDCYFKWKNLKQTVLAGSGIDSQLQKQIQTEIEKKKKNRALLHRILDVMLHLASRILPFRGKNQSLR